jgi:hypothetical protein
MKRVLICLILASFFLAPTQAQTLFLPAAAPPKPGNYNDIHTVAVVSGLRPVLTVVGEYGVLLQKKKIDISDWKLNELMAQATEKLLRTQFAVKSVTYDAAALGKIGSTEWYTGKNARIFLNPIPHEGVDAFVAIRPVDPEFTLGHLIANDDRAVIMVDYIIEVIDARKWQIVARTPSQLLVQTSRKPLIAVRPVSQRLEPSKDLSLSGQQMAILRENISTLMATSLVSTLQSANMGLALPSLANRNVVPTPPENYSFGTINTVAVISAIGSSFEFDQIAFLANKHGEIDVADWHLDEEIETFVRKAVASRFTVKDVPVDRTALRGASIVDSKNVFRPNFPGLAPSSEIDAYLVLVRYPANLLVEDNSLARRYLSGLGLEHANPVDAGYDALVKGTYVYAHYAVALIDAHTLKPLAVTTVTASPGNRRPRPQREVDPSLFPKDDWKLTAYQAGELRKATLSLLPDGIEETLLKMGLTGMTIEEQSLVQLAAP